MALFDVQTRDVEIEHSGETHTMTLKPLTGQHLGLMYDISSAFSGLDENASEEEFQKAFTGEKAEKAHKLVYETLKDSYPDVEDKKLDRFATQHMFELFEPIIELNQNVHGE